MEDLAYANRLHLHYGDVLDFPGLCDLLRRVQPWEVYNLAAQSHVKVSFELPIYTSQVNGIGTLNVLEAIRCTGMEKQVRFYQASTSELFGKVQEIPQNERTPFYPRSPYGFSKLMAFWATVNYREAYGIFACNGILFNHESPRRGEAFVTRKIAMGVARIHRKMQSNLVLGNLDAQRDWGHARDYVWCMWKMLQMEEPEDFVVATGVTTTVREFCEKAFNAVGISLKWEGKGVNEVGRNLADNSPLVLVDPDYFRPAEVDFLVGDSTKAQKELGWVPHHTTLDNLVEEMVCAELKRLGGTDL